MGDVPAEHRVQGRSTGWSWRLPWMLSVALATSAFLAAVQRPTMQARCGPAPVRLVAPTDAESDALRDGLQELNARIADLGRALDEGDALAWSTRVTDFDLPLLGWRAWPELRYGGEVVLPSGASVHGWPDTTSLGLGLSGVDAQRSPEIARALLTRARSTAQGLARALVRSRG
ncbi:MAG: hypothetical protein R3F34_01435 [Planctomycetota bacterium]